MMGMMTMMMAMMMVLKSPSGVTTPMAKAGAAVHEARFCNASSSPGNLNQSTSYGGTCEAW